MASANLVEENDIATMMLEIGQGPGKNSLPIARLKEDLLRAVEENQVLIVIGETGSGKTTQIPQYLKDAGYTAKGKIGCTQPRRMAAITVARKVAREYGCSLGQEVGFKIRFEDVTSSKTVIKYMTDGLLLRECIHDPNLDSYSVIVLDEAHERSLHTDVLFGLVKKVAQERPDLKIIVTSATLDAKKFSNYFLEAPIFEIPGRTFPVETYYLHNSNSHYIDAALNVVMQIHDREPTGDVLLFLTGQEDINQVVDQLEKRCKKSSTMQRKMKVLPLFAGLPPRDQRDIFKATSKNERKVIVSTNVAETSLTIPGIIYVVDCGFNKQKVFSPKSGMEELAITPLSKSQAKQRKGRAGRTAPGKCFRLYTRQAFNEMLPMSIPEIQRVNLASTVLNLKAIGIRDVKSFDFMDKPDDETIQGALEELIELSALDTEENLTNLGYKMTLFPLEPKLSKMLITSIDLRCSDEIITIISMFSGQQVFYRPRKSQVEADQAKAKFHHEAGDHLTLLNVYISWEENDMSEDWCYNNYINSKALQTANQVRQQLHTVMAKNGFPLEKAGYDTPLILRSICSGSFRNGARRSVTPGLLLKSGMGDYRSLLDNTQIGIHPSSALKENHPPLVVFHELVSTKKPYMRNVIRVEQEWIDEFKPVAQRTSMASLTRTLRSLTFLGSSQVQEQIRRLKAQRNGFCRTEGVAHFDKMHFDRMRPYDRVDFLVDEDDHDH